MSKPVFVETLELAGESGTTFNGMLCGRAMWKDGIAIYAKQGAKAFEEWLNTQGVENINNVNKALEAAYFRYDKIDVKEPALA
ncbi:tagatose-1,6-bisphosphate aldolase [Silvibacterium bohemicum]|uniref:Tagatose-1,6-bisphosphate aldolase n=1 Tax=Silvibacterium bohemicum TaxID=1577686 RepID=A0A841K4V0_9BACT|nr:tagatose-1,6-bisphosphate aldolase [Silvibacterium bohemicum]